MLMQGLAIAYDSEPTLRQGSETMSLWRSTPAAVRFRLVTASAPERKGLALQMPQLSRKGPLIPIPYVPHICSLLPAAIYLVVPIILPISYKGPYEGSLLKPPQLTETRLEDGGTRAAIGIDLQLRAQGLQVWIKLDLQGFRGGLEHNFFSCMGPILF